MSTDWATQDEKGCVLNVRVQVRASRTELAGIQEGGLKIRVAAPPVDGEANATLLRYLQKVLKVSASAISIIGGQKSKIKRIRIVGMRAAELVLKLQELKHFKID